MLWCDKCGQEYDRNEGGVLALLLSMIGNSFLNPPDTCWTCKKKRVLLVLAIIVFPFIILYGLLYKIPQFVLRKTGKIGLLIYLVVLANVGFWCYSTIHAKISAEFGASEKKEMAIQAKIEAEELAAKAANSTDLETKKAAEEAAIKAQKLTEEAAGIEEVAVLFGTFTDPRDQKTYKTTKIDTQNWMAENLNYNAEGSECHDDKPANCQKYGRLYNWETAMKACPSGWHLPSNEEWEVLIKLAGGEYNAGEFLKAANGWKKFNGVDSYGFSALGGPDGESGNWWSGDSTYRTMLFINQGVKKFSGVARCSVRCVQD